MRKRIIASLNNALVKQAAQAEGLDDAGGKVSDSVSRVTRPKAVKNFLSGSWLGHQLHPVLTDLPIGAWAAATALDLTAGEEGAPAARKLVGMGIIASAPTALSGASDWSDTKGKDKRIGFVHALMNANATVMQVASWCARRRGHRGVGVTLSLVAMGLTTASALLGGHLSFVRGIGVNRTAFQKRTRDWIDVAAESDIAEGTLHRLEAGDVPVVLAKTGGELRALSAVCTHAGGPLDEGTLDAEGCVTCPWHGSRFHLDDGEVDRGPASVPQPSWDVRVQGGRVLVRAA